MARIRIFGYVCTATLTSEIWPWVKVMTHPWVMDNNCVKYYPNLTWQWGVMALTRILGNVCTVTLTSEIWPWVRVMTHLSVIDSKCVKYYPDLTWQWGEHGFPVYVHRDLDLRDMILGQDYDTPLVRGQQLCKILSRSNLAVRSYGPDEDFQYMWPWHWRYDLGSRSWHTLGSWTTNVWNFIQIQLLALRSYVPDTDFQYVCTVTLTLEKWPWVMAMTHPWVMDNNRWNCIQIGQGSKKLWPGHDVNRRTDRHTDAYIPPKASVTILADFGPEFNSPFRWRSKHQTKNHSAHH